MNAWHRHLRFAFGQLPNLFSHIIGRPIAEVQSFSRTQRILMLVSKLGSAHRRTDRKGSPGLSPQVELFTNLQKAEVEEGKRTIAGRR